MRSPASVELDAAARALLRAVSGGDSPSQPSDLAVIQRELRIRLRRYARRLSDEDVDDAIADAVLAFVRAAAEGKVSEEGSPAGYLYITARNRLFNRVTRLRAWEPVANNLAEDDDAIARLLDVQASRDSVARAMRGAAQQGDATAVRVIAAWLDLAEATGTAPNSRAVGEQLSISHTAVNEAITRFRQYLAQALANPT